MRTVFLCALPVLSCSGGEVAAPDEEGRRDELVECATGGADTFERSCTLERREGEDGLTLVIRHPQGGFRRILVPRDGGAAVAADGAEQASVTVLGDGRAEIAIGGDVYRLPAALLR